MVVEFDATGIAWILDVSLDDGVAIVSSTDGDGNVRIMEGRFETPGEAVLAAERSSLDQMWQHDTAAFVVREVRHGRMKL